MKKYSLIIGLGSIGAYLIILFVFQMTQVSYVVAARELSVVFGAILGFIFLKEKHSAQKIFSIVCIIIGILLIKIA
jgi:drug/metabolite transporter (DMT)-like permease